MRRSCAWWRLDSVALRWEFSVRGEVFEILKHVHVVDIPQPLPQLCQHRIKWRRERGITVIVLFLRTPSLPAATYKDRYCSDCSAATLASIVHPACVCVCVSLYICIYTCTCIHVVGAYMYIHLGQAYILTRLHRKQGGKGRRDREGGRDSCMKIASTPRASHTYRYLAGIR